MHAAALISAMSGAPSTGAAPSVTGAAAPSGFAAALAAALGTGGPVTGGLATSGPATGAAAPAGSQAVAPAPTSDLMAGLAAAAAGQVSSTSLAARAPAAVGEGGEPAGLPLAAVELPSMLFTATPAAPPPAPVASATPATASKAAETAVITVAAPSMESSETAVPADPQLGAQADGAPHGVAPAPTCRVAEEPAPLESVETGVHPAFEAAVAFAPTPAILAAAPAPASAQTGPAVASKPSTPAAVAAEATPSLPASAPAGSEVPIEAAVAPLEHGRKALPSSARRSNKEGVAADGRGFPVGENAPETTVPSARGASPAAPASAAPATSAAPSSAAAAAAAAPASAPAPATPAALAAVLTSPAVVSLVGERVAAQPAAVDRRADAAKSTGPALAASTGLDGVSGQPTSTSTVAAAANTAGSGFASARGGTGGESAPAPTAAADAPALEPAEAAGQSATQEIPASEVAHASSAPAETRPAASPVRGSPETVASLAAEIARKLESRNSRFEIALDPLGLGMVNVSIDIGADGRISAQMAFERPEAAAELRGRGQELQRALEQAGFDLSKGGLSFEHGAGRDRPGQDQPQGRQARTQAFQAALLAAETADALPALPLRLRDRAGLDVRI